MGLVRHAERKDGVQYDWVVRSRADLLWLHAHPSVCQMTREVAYTHTAPWVDFHTVLPRRCVCAWGRKIVPYVAA